MQNATSNTDTPTMKHTNLLICILEICCLFFGVLLLKLTYEILLATALNERRHSSFRGSTIWNDISKNFKLVNYFRFCRLHINYLIEHPYIL